MKIYYAPNTRAVRIVWLFEELELPYKVFPIDIREGAQHAPEFVEMSPNNKIPAIVDDGAGILVGTSFGIGTRRIAVSRDGSGTWSTSEAWTSRSLKPYFNDELFGIGSINSTMQCMMKEICGQCLQQHIDPETGECSHAVFSCFNQDQRLDHVDFGNLNDRLRTNTVLEKLTNMWLDHVLTGTDIAQI